MKSVAKLFGKKERYKSAGVQMDWPLPDTLIGIEIEAEASPGTRWPNGPSAAWEIVPEGSLLHGREYVLVDPLKGNELAESIHDIFNGAIFKRSLTGSTHIHIDVLETDDDIELVRRLALLIFALEPSIFAIADPGREWSGYTNKLSSAPDDLIGALLNATEDTNFVEIRNMCSKGKQGPIGRYYGLNIMAMAKYGSLEFRYFPTAESIQELIDWTKLVMSFKKAAREVGSTENLLLVFSNEQAYQEFITYHFGQWKDTILKEVPCFAAISAIRKALAIAAGFANRQREENESVEYFNPTCVLDSEVRSKFVTKRGKPPSTAKLLVVGIDGITQAPVATATPLGTIFITHGGSVYLNIKGYGWVDNPGYWQLQKSIASIIPARIRAKEILEKEELGKAMVGAGYSATSTKECLHTLRTFVQSTESFGDEVQLDYISMCEPTLDGKTTKGKIIQAFAPPIKKQNRNTPQPPVDEWANTPGIQALIDQEQERLRERLAEHARVMNRAAEVTPQGVAAKPKAPAEWMTFDERLDIIEADLPTKTIVD